MRKELQLSHRQTIERLIAKKVRRRIIAGIIGFSDNCVARELKNNSEPYNANCAQRAADKRRANKFQLQRKENEYVKFIAPTKPKCSCHGAGTKTIYRNHLPAIVLPCPVCTTLTDIDNAVSLRENNS